MSREKLVGEKPALGFWRLRVNNSDFWLLSGGVGGAFLELLLVVGSLIPHLCLLLQRGP